MKISSGLLFLVFFFRFSQLEVFSSELESHLKPNYTSIQWNVTYKSHKSPSEDHNGLVEGYYTFVNVIVDFILPDALPQELLSNGIADILFSDIGKILWAYRRLIIFVIVLIIQIIFLIGSNMQVLCSCIFFCTKFYRINSSKSNSKLRKWLWFVCVYTALVFLLLMLVFAHQSNQNMDEGIDTVVLSLDDTIVDVEMFVDTTLKQLEILLLNNLQDYLAFFLETGEKTATNILRDLEATLGAIDFSKIFEDIEDNFNFVKPIFDEMEIVLSEVEDLGKTINNDIEGLKNMMENLICETAECEQLKRLIPSLGSVYDGGASLVNGTYAELENIADLGKEGLEDLGNLTYLIDGEAIKEGKALENLTAKIAGNVIEDLEDVGGGLANFTSAIGGKAIEESKALKNLTANVAGDLIADFEIPGGGITNFTSGLGEEAKEEGKALENLTAKIAANVIEDLETARGGLANLTSVIGEKSMSGGKALKNLTANIAEKVIGDLEIAGGDLTNLTSVIGGKAIDGERYLRNLTANIAGNVIEDLEDVRGGLTNFTSAIGGKAIEESKALKNLTANVAGDLIADFEIAGGGITNFTSGLGEEAIEEGKALENLTAKIAGNLIEDLETAREGLANLTSVIGEKSISGGKALKNLTANIAEKVIGDLEIAGGDLTNLTSVIGGKAIDGERYLKNLTANITGNVIKDLEITEKGVGNLTSAIGGEAVMEGKALENLTATLAGHVIGDLEIAGRDLSNLTSAIGGEALEGRKVLQNLTADIAGNVIGDLKDAGEGLTNLTENVVGGLGNVAKGVENELKNKGATLKNLTENVAGGVVSGIGNVASGLEDGVEDVFGGFGKWNFGSGNKKKKNEEADNVVKVFKKGETENSTAYITGNAISEGSGDIGESSTNLKENMVGAMENVPGNVGNELKNEGEALKDLTTNIVGGVKSGMGSVKGGIESEVGRLFKDLGSWGSGEKKTKSGDIKPIVSSTAFINKKNGKADISEKAKNKGETLEDSKANATEDVIGKTLKDTGKSLTNLTENMVVGLKNVAGGVGNELKNEGKALKNWTSNVEGGVAGGIGSVTGGIGREVGDLFKGLGGWGFGSGNAKSKSEDIDPTVSRNASKNKENEKADIADKATKEQKSLEDSKANITDDIMAKTMKDTGKSSFNQTENIVGSMKNVTGGVGNDLRIEGKALEDLTTNVTGGVASGIGSVAGGIRSEVGGLFKGLGGWDFGSGDAKSKSKDIEPTVSGNALKNEKNEKADIADKATKEQKSFEYSKANVTEDIMSKTLKNTGKSLTNLTENMVSGLRNVAGGVGNELKNEGKALKNLSTSVAGGVASDIGSLAGGIERKVGGLFEGLGGWGFGSGDTKSKSEDIEPSVSSNLLTNIKNGKADIAEKVDNKDKSLEDSKANVTEDIMSKTLKDSGKSSANLTENRVGSMKKIPGGVENDLKNEGKALKDLTTNVAGGVASGIGRVAGGIESEVGGLFKGLGGWGFGSADTKYKSKDIEPTASSYSLKNIKNEKADIGEKVYNKDKYPEDSKANVSENIMSKTLKDIGKSSANLTEKIVGSMKNIPGGVKNDLENEGKALKDLTTNVAGGVASGIGRVAGGLESEVGGLFKGLGGWGFGSADAKSKSEDIEPSVSSNLLTNIKNGKADIAEKVDNKDKSLEDSKANVTEDIMSKTLKDSGKSSANLTENIVGSMKKIPGGVENDLKNEGKALKDLTTNVAGGVASGIGRDAGGIESEVGGLFKGLGGWGFGSGNTKSKSKDIEPSLSSNLLKNIKNEKADIAKKVDNKDESLEDSKANVTEDIMSKTLKDTGKSLTYLTENMVSGLKNVAGGVGNQLKNEGNALKDLTTSVRGGIDSEVGGLFKGLGGWGFGSGDKQNKPKGIEPSSLTRNVFVKKDIEETTVLGNDHPTNKATENNEKNTNIFTSSGIFTPDKKDKVKESTMDLTLQLERDENGGVKDSSIGQLGGFNSLFSGLGDLASKVEAGVEKSKNVSTEGTGDTSSNVKNEIDSIFGGLGSWSNGNSNNKHDVMKIVSSSTTEISTTVKNIDTKVSSGFGNFFGGLENLASGVSSGIKKSGDKLAGITSNMVGGVKNTTGNVKTKIGSFFGDWTSGTYNKNQNKAVETRKSKIEEENTTKNEHNGFASWLGYSTSGAFNGAKKEEKTSKVSGVEEKATSGVGNKISDASEKLYKMGGGNFFGFRGKRGLGLSFNDLKRDFDTIFNTINEIEDYIVNDLQHLNNVSVLLAPVIDEIDNILKDVLVEIEEELKEATKPLEGFFAATLDKIISIENSILNATHVIQTAQEMISWFEVYRYHISNFLAAALLISFTLLTFGISIRITCNNAITKCAYKGGFTLLHITALLMAVTSLIYIVVGVTSQKVLCETLDTNYREDNVMRILSRINPSKFGLLIDFNLHKVILRCHRDKSLYEVTALKSVMNIEKAALEFFHLESIEKEFDPLLNMTMDLSKYLPLGAIHKIEDDLNFESFEKILDFPIFAQIEKLEKKFAHIPLIGPVIKTIAGKIVSFKDKIASIQSPVQSASIGFPNLLKNIKKLLVDVENELLEIEAKSVKTLQDVVLDFKTLLVSSLKDYVYNRLIYSIKHDIGKCRPISAAFNTTLNSVCGRITTPANGHWFSWFCGVILSIFLIVLSREADGKINRFQEGQKENPAGESSKKVEEIEMKTFDNISVEIDRGQEEIPSDDALG